MGKLGDLLTGIQVLEEIDSPVNGKIKVVKGIAFGTYIQVEGLTQSGGILKNVWRKPLKKLHSSQITVHRSLILGLGGGTVAGLVRQFWPEAKITGVDLDPVMVDLGKKYLELDKYNVNVVIEDAYEYIGNGERDTGDREKIGNRVQGTKNRKRGREEKYDLILVDLYVGREYPEKFGSENYIQRVRNILARGGIAIFNRLYYGEKRSEAVRFGNKLEKFFKKVEVIYPEANIMYLCS
jgi:spermidine synthase